MTGRLQLRKGFEIMGQLSYSKNRTQCRYRGRVLLGLSGVRGAGRGDGTEVFQLVFRAGKVTEDLAATLFEAAELMVPGGGGTKQTAPGGTTDGQIGPDTGRFLVRVELHFNANETPKEPTVEDHPFERGGFLGSRVGILAAPPGGDGGERFR